MESWFSYSFKSSGVVWLTRAALFLYADVNASVCASSRLANHVPKEMFPSVPFTRAHLSKKAGYATF
jgi:hypothetical protein